MALAPYKAEEAPGINSTLLTSNSLSPNKFPIGKFNPGAELSIMSTSCTKPSL